MSYSDEIQVEDLSSLHKYRTELPNIIFEYGLDPYEGWLYMCLKKISGDNGGCFASNKYLSIKAKISERKIRYCKQALVKKGLIKITKRLKANGSKNTDLVQIIDLWPNNFIHFKEKFSLACCAKDVRHNMPKIPAQQTEKEKPSEEDPLKKNKRNSANDNEKHIKLRENIVLTQKQKESLLKKYSEEDFNKIIDKLSTYKLEKHKEYTSDFKAIERWVELWFKNKQSETLISKEITEMNTKWIKSYFDYRSRVGAMGILNYNTELAWDEKSGFTWSFDDPKMKTKIEKFYKNYS